MSRCDQLYLGPAVSVYESYRLPLPSIAAPASLLPITFSFSRITYATTNMADTMDVDPVVEHKGKTKEDGGKLDKKRFEVKKVRTVVISRPCTPLADAGMILELAVERCCAVGLG